MRAPQTGIQGCCHPAWWLLRSWGNARSKVSKETGLVPDSWGVYAKNGFSEPRGLHLHIHTMLNSFTWYQISDAQTACSLCCKLVFSLTYPPASLEQFSQSHWNAVPGTGEPGGLPSMGSHRVGRDWSDLAAAAAAFSHPTNIHWAPTDTGVLAVRDRVGSKTGIKLLPDTLCEYGKGGLRGLITQILI